MKKILGFLLVAVFCAMLVFSGTGCKAKAVEETAAATAAETEATVEETIAEDMGSLRFLSYPWFALSEDALAKFTEKTGIEVIIEVLGYEELNTKVATSSAAGVAPADVFSTYIVPLAAHVAAGFVQPLDEFITSEMEEDILGMDVFKFDGKQMGVPTYYDITGMVYNTEMLESAGIDKVPETLDELVEACQKIKDAGVSEYPLIMPLAAQAGTASRWQQLSLAYGEPLFDDDFQPLFVREGSSGYKALQLMVDYLGTLVDPASVDFDTVMNHDQLFSGDGCFIFSSPGLLVEADNEEISNVVGKTAITLMPGTTEQRSAALDFYLDGFAVSSLSDNLESAVKFIEWYNTAEAAELAYNELGILPSRKSLLRKFIDEGITAGGEFIFEQAEYGQPVFPAGIPPWFEEWETDVAVQVNQVARGNITIMDALNNIANKALELQE